MTDLLKSIEELLAESIPANKGQEMLQATIGTQQFKVGESYANRRYLAEAFKWYLKSAQTGYAPAQHKVAECYRHARGVGRDYEQMIYWYTQSAEQDTEGEECYSLGRIYRNGVFVPQDHAMAYKWYKRVLEISPRDRDAGVVPKILYTFDMEDMQSPPTQDGHIYSCHNKLPFTYYSLGLHSRAMRKFEAENLATAEQKKWLAFGAVLITRNFESSRTLALLESESESQKELREGWGIYSEEDALKTASQLCAADVHTPIVDEIYKNFIQKKDDFNFFSEEDACMHLKNNTLPLVFQRYYLESSGFGPDPEILPTEDVFAAFAEIHANSDAFTEYSNAGEATENILEFKDKVEAYKKEYMDNLYQGFAAKIKERINPYVYANNEIILNGWGRPPQLPSLAAWDYGRVAYIVRTSVKAGYMSEESAWSFLQKAAEAASSIYSSWHDYLIAYILGRALGYKNDSRDLFNDVFRYLREDDQSPFNMEEIKWGGKPSI